MRCWIPLGGGLWLRIVGSSGLKLRLFSYVERECRLNDVFLEFEEFFQIHNSDRILTPLSGTCCVEVYNDLAGSRLCCRIAKRFIQFINYNLQCYKQASKPRM